jgi:hypothetical protein
VEATSCTGTIPEIWFHGQALSIVWDLCLNLVKDMALWALAAKKGLVLVHYLKAIKDKREGFASGNPICGLMVGEKPLRMKRLARIG